MNLHTIKIISEYQLKALIHIHRHVSIKYICDKRKQRKRTPDEKTIQQIDGNDVYDDHTKTQTRIVQNHEANKLKSTSKNLQPYQS
jgi:hypothetical protein